MVNIAILEDDVSVAKTLQRVLETYARQNDAAFNIRVFPNAEVFLADAKTSFDIAFMDIELPGMNGMDAAFKLRENDRQDVYKRQQTAGSRPFLPRADVHILAPVSGKKHRHLLLPDASFRRTAFQ